MQRLGLKERLNESDVIEAWAEIVGEFIAAHSAPVSLREGVLCVRVLQPALHYQFEQISKADILRKLKQRFGPKIIRDPRRAFSVPPRFRMPTYPLMEPAKKISKYPPSVCIGV